MKNINPLYILGSILVIILYLFIDTAIIKNDIAKQVKKNSQLQTEINSILLLKKEYSDPKKKKSDFLRLMDNSLVKKFIASKEIKKNTAYIELSGADDKASKWFIQKLINEEFKIKSCEIKKIDEYTLDIKAGVIF